MGLQKIIKTILETSQDAIRLEKETKHGKRNLRVAILVFFLVLVSFIANGNLNIWLDETNPVRRGLSFELQSSTPWGLITLFVISLVGCMFLLVWAERKGWIEDK